MMHLPRSSQCFRGCLVRRAPPLRQQRVQLAHRHGRHAGQDAAEVGLGIEAMTFGAGNEAVKRGGTLGGLVMAGKQPVLAAKAADDRPVCW